MRPVSARSPGSLLSLLSGCATHAPLACPQRRRTAPRSVLFATDRKQENPAKTATASAGGSLEFGPGRTDPPMPAARLAGGAGSGRRTASGSSIAPSRSRPAHIAAARPATARCGRPIAKSPPLPPRAVRAAIRSGPAPRAGERRQVLLFIHGYNDTFNYAVLKTAQLAADLDLVTCEGQMRGVPIAYSWPAQGTFLSYLADEENAEWTQQRFVPFLRALAAVAQQEGADLAHHRAFHGRAPARALARRDRQQRRRRRAAPAASARSSCSRRISPASSSTNTPSARCRSSAT